MIFGWYVAVLGVLSCVEARADEAANWSIPTSIIQEHGRLAIDGAVHVVGHDGRGRLVHRRSNDHGQTWGETNDIADGAGNVPMMYGGFVASEGRLYLLTADGDMGGEARQIDFRTSEDQGRTWSEPVRITSRDMPLFRCRMVVSGGFVHVVGMGAPTPSGSTIYLRSSDRGVRWDAPRMLAADLGAYGGGQTVAVSGDFVHVVYTRCRGGVGAGDALYTRSTDAGNTWSEPVVIGERSEESDRQARVLLVSNDNDVFAI
jgi:hypothetical protein